MPIRFSCAPKSAQEETPASCGQERSRNETNRHRTGARHSVECDAGRLPAHRANHMASELLGGRKPVAHLQRVSSTDVRRTVFEAERGGSFSDNLCRHNRRRRSDVLLSGNGCPQRTGECAIKSGYRCSSSSLQSRGGVRAPRSGDRLDPVPRRPPEATCSEFAYALTERFAANCRERCFAEGH